MGEHIGKAVIDLRVASVADAPPHENLNLPVEELHQIAAYVTDLCARLEKAEAEREAALERSRDYPTISARLHDVTKDRDALRKHCTTARNDALEEAAKVADTLFSTERHDIGACAYYGNVQRAIRALKDKDTPHDPLDPR